MNVLPFIQAAGPGVYAVGLVALVATGVGMSNAATARFGMAPGLTGAAVGLLWSLGVLFGAFQLQALFDAIAYAAPEHKAMLMAVGMRESSYILVFALVASVPVALTGALAVALRRPGITGVRITGHTLGAVPVLGALVGLALTAATMASLGGALSGDGASPASAAAVASRISTLILATEATAGLTALLAVAIGAVTIPLGVADALRPPRAVEEAS